MNQIVLLTDGCSNSGLSPVTAAAMAARQGIVVNVIGIVEEGTELGERGAAEIAEIARAGGGISRMVDPRALSRTVQMVTRHAMMQTIRQTVQQELKQLIGGEVSLSSIPPGPRSQIVQRMEEWSEDASLRVALLIDTSASMRPKLQAVEEACRDFVTSLRARSGKSELSVLHFPGNTGNGADLLAGWSDLVAKPDKLFYNLVMKGITPTGPALMGAIRHMVGDGSALAEKREGAAAPTQQQGWDWSEYIV